MTSELSLPQITREITQDRINAYAEVSGDFNPIHTDPAFAAETQFGGTITHGMLLLGFLSDVMTRAYGEAWATSGRLRTRFRSPGRPGDTVVVSGTVRSVEEAPDERKLIRCTLECRNQEGLLLASGDAQVTVPLHEIST